MSLNTQNYFSLAVYTTALNYPLVHFAGPACTRMSIYINTLLPPKNGRAKVSARPMHKLTVSRGQLALLSQTEFMTYMHALFGARDDLELAVALARTGCTMTPLEKEALKNLRKKYQQAYIALPPDQVRNPSAPSRPAQITALVSSALTPIVPTPAALTPVT